ncbi:hypothetical protein OCU04_005732 [Sclerotinia nivalis]|uniref:Uncharacterized protein n=1 Tax=Sclerotinia nivalis TaxID=352851 RepID=A0A9X0DLI8_9HELO|nr:hypothetical protein OCU04_005732 [Sclerotinia nivalis]
MMMGCYRDFGRDALDLYGIALEYLGIYLLIPLFGKYNSNEMQYKILRENLRMKGIWNIGLVVATLGIFVYSTLWLDAEPGSLQLNYLNGHGWLKENCSHLTAFAVC